MRLWEEDPRFQDAKWRFFRTAALLVLGLGVLIAVFTGNFGSLGVLIVVGSVAGLGFWLMGLVCGVAMKALFHLGWSLPAWFAKVARKLRH